MIILQFAQPSQLRKSLFCVKSLLLLGVWLWLRPFCAELSGGAAARWQPLARGCLLPGSQPYTDTEPGLAGAIHRAPLLITTPHSSTSDRPTSHHNSSQLITSQLITVPLLTPLLTPHLSHQKSSQLYFSHLTSQVHFSHLTSHTSPKFTLSLDIPVVPHMAVAEVSIVGNL